MAEQLERGILCGGQSALEAEAAELFCTLAPCAEKLRFASSGSEAVQAALALALARAACAIIDHPHDGATRMKASTLVSAITAATLAVGSAGAIAQPRGEPQRNAQDDRREVREHDRREVRDREWHREEYRLQEQYRRDARPGYRPGPPPHAQRPGPPPHSNAGGRGAGPRHDIYRGARLPSYYRTQHYVVSDWRYHRLAPPPRGHYWVQVGADYLLVAIATGIVVQIILGY